MATANLCKCNKCDNTLIDQNPQINAPEFNLIGNEINMMWSETDRAWVCPVCRTDAFLSDVDNRPNDNVNVQGLIGHRAYQYAHAHT